MKVKFTRQCNFTTIETVLDTNEDSFKEDLRTLESLFRYVSSQDYSEPKKTQNKAISKPSAAAYDGPATEKQLAYLEKLGYEYRAGDEDMTYSQANALIKSLRNEN